jgi:hypothetical protein
MMSGNSGSASRSLQVFDLPAFAKADAVDASLSEDGLEASGKGLDPYAVMIAWPLRRDRLSPANLSAAMMVTSRIEVTEGMVLLALFDIDGRTILDKAYIDASEGMTSRNLLAAPLLSCGMLVVISSVQKEERAAFKVFGLDCELLDERQAIEADRMLTAIYDLNIQPYGFDFVYFLMHAEYTRWKAGLNAIQVVLIPPDHEHVARLPEGYDRAVDLQARHWRIKNLILPILDLFPSVSGHVLAGDRRQGLALRHNVSHVFPGPIKEGLVPCHAPYPVINQELLPDAPIRWPEAPEQGRRFIRQWMDRHVGQRRLILLTIRQYAYHTERNSNLEAWGEFASRLDPEKYVLGYVADTDYALDVPPPPLAKAIALPEAAFNMGLRMAAYELAYLNMFTSGGPPLLGWFNPRCRYLLFKIPIAGSMFCETEGLQSLGFQPGRPPSFATPLQRFVWWGNDDLDVIEREFSAMCQLIEAAEGG